MTSSHKKPALEVRSIDYVPPSERKGKVWHQGPFWFMGNFVLTTMMTGFIGPATGLSAFYSILAVIAGVLFGTFFMAFHANQGPRMGLPQMIQSRAQFGVRGAIIPFIAVVFVYVGFNVFNVILATEAIHTVGSGSRAMWYVVIILFCVAIAVVGHDMLHFVQRWLTYVLIVVFGLLTWIAVTTLDINSAIAHPTFSWAAFLGQLSAAAGYQISYSVYVSDYSRYLPENTPARKVIGWTYLGASASALWLMSLGAIIASAIPDPNTIAAVQQIGDKWFAGFGTFIVIISIPALIGIMAVNCYGAMLTSVSAIDGFRPVVPTLKIRIVGVLLIAVIIYVVALTLPESYLDSFNNFLLLMLYFLVPWTAVNLVDFYWVRQGHYDIKDIFNPRGVYGKWSLPGLLSYLAGVVSMIPFISLSFFTGPLFKLLHGVDISFVIGLLVSGVLYAFLMRGYSPEKGAKHGN